MLVAITRGVSAALGACELTHLQRAPIDVDLARRQHRDYEEALRRAGCQVVSLPPQHDLPDAVFVEDVAVVLDEFAIVTRPGAASRRPEIASVAAALKPYRDVTYIEEPGTLDGGDVLRLGRRLFVGLSGRSNRAAVDQLRALVSPHGYSVTGVAVSGCLHLKSAVTEVARGTLLVNPAWVDPGLFGDVDVMEVDPGEPCAANAVSFVPGPGPFVRNPDPLVPGPGPFARSPDPLVPGPGPFVRSPGPSGPGTPATIYPSSFPRTRRLLESRGIPLDIVDVSELQKAEGAVTCCSLVFEA